MDAIRRVKILSEDTLSEMSYNAYQYSRKNYTIDAYQYRMKAVLDNILLNEKNEG